MKEKTRPQRIPRGLQAALDLINPHLYSVEERIRDQARSFDPSVEGYIAYACASKGKRLRPALALFGAGATGGINPAHIDLAVIIELIHVATLVHDDILDGAERRRAQPTANAKWGTNISVLLGDVLFSHALRLATQFQNSEVSRRIAIASCNVCQGEIIQTQRRFDLKLSIPDYLRVIEMKTAALFAAAAELGAFLNEASPEQISAMKKFGLKLGTAYQIYDDCLDLAGTEDSAGKTLGSDLRKGKLTLPVLAVLRKANERDRDRMSAMLLEGEAIDTELVASFVRRQGGMTAAANVARDLLRDAAAELKKFRPSRYRDALAKLSASLLKLVDGFRTR